MAPEPIEEESGTAEIEPPEAVCGGALEGGDDMDAIQAAIDNPGEVNDSHDDWPFGIPDGWTVLDADHLIRPTSCDNGPHGFIEAHRRADGKWCGGAIARADDHHDYEVPRWDVLSEEPLTLSPSLLCRACGSHGFVRDGKWVDA